MASAAAVKPKPGFGFRVTVAWPSSASISKSFRVPIRVCRPLLTGEALRRSPLMEAGGAHPASVEGVPLIAATTRPAVILAGRPTAERAPDAMTPPLAYLFAERFQDKPLVNPLLCRRRLRQQSAQFFNAPNAICECS